MLVVDHSLGQWFVLEKKLKYYKLKDKQVYSREKNCNDLDLDGTFESGAEWLTTSDTFPVEISSN